MVGYFANWTFFFFNYKGRLLIPDTDSLVYLTRWPGDKMLPKSEGLYGDFKDEISDGYGSGAKITLFAGNYSFSALY